MSSAGCKHWFKLLGGSLCLDFANTVDWRLLENPVELLDSYRALIDWSLQAGVLTERQASLLGEESERAPLAAAAVLNRAIELREAVFKVFSAWVGEHVVHPGGLEVLNAMIPQAMGRIRLVGTDAGFACGWPDTVALDCMFWPVIRSAADLLTSPELNRVKMCSDPRCGWLFVDKSKNGSRIWCSMQDCGNRAKARRFHDKQKP